MSIGLSELSKLLWVAHLSIWYCPELGSESESKAEVFQLFTSADTCVLCVFLQSFFFIYLLRRQDIHSQLDEFFQQKNHMMILDYFIYMWNWVEIEKLIRSFF